MTARWGHFAGDLRRHIMFTLPEESLSRRKCRRIDVRGASEVPQDSSYSDLPACLQCNTRGGRLVAGVCPASRRNWIAGTGREMQAELPVRFQ